MEFIQLRTLQLGGGGGGCRNVKLLIVHFSHGDNESEEWQSKVSHFEIYYTIPYTVQGSEALMTG